MKWEDRQSETAAALKAVAHGDWARFEAIVRACRDVDALGRDGGGGNLLHDVVILRYPHAVSLLLECGASVDVRDKEGWTPLHWAAARCATEPCHLLLRAGADVEAMDHHGRTPLDVCGISASSSREVRRVLQMYSRRGAVRERLSATELANNSVDGPTL